MLLTVSALLALLASGAVGVIVATRMSSRVHQIGILKAIGARPGQVIVVGLIEYLGSRWPPASSDCSPASGWPNSSPVRPGTAALAARHTFTVQTNAAARPSDRAIAPALTTD